MKALYKGCVISLTGVEVWTVTASLVGTAAEVKETEVIPLPIADDIMLTIVASCSELVEGIALTKTEVWLYEAGSVETLAGRESERAGMVVVETTKLVAGSCSILSDCAMLSVAKLATRKPVTA